MASPFAVFRKNQKVMYAGAALLAIVSFVFLSSNPYSGPKSKNQPEQQVVVQTKLGPITRQELATMVRSRQLVEQFLYEIVFRRNAQILKDNAAIYKEQVDPQQLQMMAAQFSQREFQSIKDRLLQRYSEDPSVAAVETMILAKKAQDLGIVISNETITDIFRDLGQGKVDRATTIAIVSSLNVNGQTLSQEGFMNAFRNELLAGQVYVASAMTLSWDNFPPQERFSYYSELNRRATLSVASLNVAEFVKEAPEPTETDLKSLYEKYKNDVPNPDSPDPGFKIPWRVKVAYFEVKPDSFIEKAKKSVTDEEVAKYYEEHKNPEFRVPDAERNFRDELNKGDFGEKKEGAAADAPSADDKKPDAPIEEKKGDEKQRDAAAAPMNTPAPASAPATKAPATKAPATTPTRPAGGPIQPAPAKAPQKKSSAIERPRFTPVAQARPNSKPKAAVAPAAAPKGDAAKATDTKALDVTAPDAKPAETKPDDAKTPDPKATDATTDKAKSEADRFEPFEKVKEQIRDTIARDNGRKARDEAVSAIQGRMNEYTRDLIRFDSGQVTERPQLPNFEQVAKDLDVTYKVFDEPLSAIEIERQTDIGRSSMLQRRAGVGALTKGFGEIVFDDKEPLFRPETTRDGETNYLFWKIEETKGRVPTFEECQKRVVDAWKLNYARERARKKAEEYVAKSHAEKKPLHELYGGEKGQLLFEETAPFSWLKEEIAISLGGAPKISPVDHVEQPGKEFMQAVFSCSLGESGWAMNVPQMRVYLFDVTKLTPPLDELQDRYATADPRQYLMVGAPVIRDAFKGWIDSINAEYGVKWEKTPDAIVVAEE